MMRIMAVMMMLLLLLLLLFLNQFFSEQKSSDGCQFVFFAVVVTISEILHPSFLQLQNLSNFRVVQVADQVR